MADPISNNTLRLAGVSGIDSRLETLGKRQDATLTRRTEDVGKVAESVAEEGKIAERAGEELKPVEAKMSEAQKNAPDPDKFKEEKAPDYKRPTMDPKELQEAFGALMAVSMFVGATSRTPYNNIMSAMTGAMNGFMKGDQAVVKESLATYDKNLQAIKERNATMRDELEAAWKKHRNDLEGYKLERDLIMAKFDRQLAVQAGKTKSLETMVKGDEAELKSEETAIDKLYQVKATAEANLLRIEEARANQEANRTMRMTIEKMKQGYLGGVGGAGSGDDAGVLKMRGSMIRAGVPITQVVPGYGTAAVRDRQKAQAEAMRQLVEEGKTPEEAGQELANAQIGFVAGKASETQLVKMLGATRPALNQLDFNLKKAKEEMNKLGSTDISPILNAIARKEQKWTGDPAYSGLFFFLDGAGQEAARIMSGGQASIAQLHEGAAERARQWMDISMTPASFDEVAKGMRAEAENRIENYESAIQKQRTMRTAPSRYDGTQDPTGDIRKAVEAVKGWKYEPDKYDYRIGADGVPQRKPRGG